MCAWTNCPGVRHDSTRPHPNSEQQPRLSVSEQPHPSSQAPRTDPEPLPQPRFRFASEQKLTQLAKGLVPENTSKSTKWAINNFEAWMRARNASHSEDPIPEDVLMSTDTNILNTHLSRFVVETRKSNGEAYPPATLHQLLCGVLRYMRDCNPGCPNFLDKKDGRFKQLYFFHDLHSEGTGRQVKHTETISVEEENQLWERGVLDCKTPRGLQNAVFYTIGKMFCLRGGQEHRALKLSQLQRCADDRYIYYENVSKNRNGSFKQLHVKSKVVPVYACPEAGERCPVHILDQYISRLPEEAKEKDLFYVRPLEKMPLEPSKAWYSSVPLGKHTLQQKVKKMCAEAGVVGSKTNHSLRATSATDMYKAGAPEKLIQERTGHRSIEALRTYERSSEEQHKAVSSLLSVPQHSTYAYHHSSSQSISTCVQPALSPSLPPFFSGMPVSFQNLQGCTINISSAPQPPPQPSSNIDILTETELDQLFSQIQ